MKTQLVIVGEEWSKLYIPPPLSVVTELFWKVQSVIEGDEP